MESLGNYKQKQHRINGIYNMSLFGKNIPWIKYLFFAGLSVFVSCEEVIKIDLHSAGPELVADGIIEQDSVGWIRLTGTTDYFNTGEPGYIENATVTLTDEKGESEILDYKGNGLYRGVSIKGKPFRSYIMQIAGENFSYAASSKLFPAPRLYSVSYKESVFQHPGGSMKSYTIDMKFSDDPMAENFYNIEFYNNGKPGDNGYTLIRDSFFASGDTITFSPRWMNFEAGDRVTVKVYSIDRNTYAYYNQLNDILDAGMGGSSTPYNPVSNFGSSVLGYFRACSGTSFTSVVK
jgi:hypothetical protein